MKNQFANDIIQRMLPHIDNAQADKLRKVLFVVMESYEIAESHSKAPSEPTNQYLVNGFLSAKRIEGCSEKSLVYYRKTIDAMLAAIGLSLIHIYTLKIIREDIETAYREKLEEVYQSIENLVQKKDVKKEDIVEHPNYVKELLRYIIGDLKRFRVIQGDDTLGGMVICETSEQARRLFAYFDEIQNELNSGASNQSHFKAGLILYDSDDKETREGVITDFKDNFKVDILIVFNMLLTGFDAPRLKRLYFGRKLKDHNLLQAITRVNRPYGKNRYGFIIDFADIKKNFDETNAAYLAELNKFNDPDEVGEGNEVNILAQVMEDPAELIQRMKKARQVLFDYSLDNAEEFSTEISAIEDKGVLLELKKALIEVRDCCNLSLIHI